MSSLDKSINSKFNDLRLAISEEKGKWPSSQGINAIIMIYPPKKEKAYIERVKEEYADEYIIDLSDLFVQHITQIGIEKFKWIYEEYRGESVLKDDENPNDYLKSILKEIEKAVKMDKLPILIRTGILYGTEIRNKNILESKEISKIKRPLIILYPGTIVKDLEGKESVYYLDIYKASDYRGHFI